MPAHADDGSGRTVRWITSQPRSGGGEDAYVRILRRNRPYDWTGLYFGASVGGALNTNAYSWEPNAPGFPNSAADIVTASTGSSSDKVLIAGGDIGLNWQVDQWVYGIEADYGVLRLKEQRSDNLARFGFANSPLAQSMDIDGIATARGRLGYAFDRLMIYATGGVAFAETHYRDTITFGASGTTNAASQDSWMIAPVYGGGVEYAMTKNWIAKVSYLHTEIGATSFTSTNSNPALFPVSTIVHRHADASIDIVRFGLGYKF